MQITIITSILLTIILLIISIRTILHRRTHGIGLGDGNDENLLRKMRASANFSEYALFGTFLIFLLEINKFNFYLLSIISVCLVLGRAFHAYTFSFTNGNMFLRVSGTALTLTSFILSIFSLISILINK